MSRGPAVAALVALVALAFFAGLGSYGLMDPDEPRYAEGARSLSEPDADPFVPQYNGEPRIVKPIVTYWLISGSYAVFGVNEWGARFPSAVAGLLVVLLVLDLGRRLVDERTGWLAAIVASTSLLWVVISRLATTDALLTLCITLAIQAHVRARECGYRRLGPALVLWTALALGMAVKGPVGVLVPCLVIMVEAGIRHGYGRRLAVCGLLAAGFLCAAESGATWLRSIVVPGILGVGVLGLGARLLRREPETMSVPVAAATVLALAGYVLQLGGGASWNEQIGFLGAALGLGFVVVLVHRQEPSAPGMRRLPIGVGIFILVGFFWYAAILLRDPTLRDLFLEETSSRFTGSKDIHLESAWFLIPVALGGFLPWSIALFPAARRAFRREDGLARSLPVAWVLVTLLFFSLSPNKLPSYVAPATAGVALAVGIWLRRGIADEEPGFKWWLLGLAVGLQAAALGAGLFMPEKSAPGGRPIALTAAALLTVSTLGAVVGLRRPGLGVAGLVLGFVMAVGFAGVKAVPRVEELRSEKALEPILVAHPDLPVVCHSSLSGGIVFYGRRTVEVVDELRDVAARLAAPEPVLVWIKLRRMKKLRRHLSAELAVHVWHETPERLLLSNVPR